MVTRLSAVSALVGARSPGKLTPTSRANAALKVGLLAAFKACRQHCASSLGRDVVWDAACCDCFDQRVQIKLHELLLGRCDVPVTM